MAETGARNQVVEFYTIEGTNEVVRAGDCVRLEHWENDSTMSTIIARVEQLQTDNDGSVKLKVRQYYTPEDVARGRRNIFGAKELFLSDHRDIQSANMVREKVNVHSLEDYDRLLVVNDADYYCRFEYQVASRTFTPESVEVYCKCEMPYNPDISMVTCVECGERFHLECIGMTVEQGMTDEQEHQLDDYLCDDCSQLDDAPSVVGADGDDSGDDSLLASTYQGVARTGNADRAPILDGSLPWAFVRVTLADGTNVVTITLLVTSVFIFVHLDSGL